MSRVAKLCLSIAAVPAMLFAASAQSGLPGGTYTTSCQDARMKGSTLHANCQTAEGKIVPARLENAGRCADGIVNLNGILTCQAGTIPPGSYLSTCVDPQVQGTTLRAKCPNDKGKNNPAELRNANQCIGDIANQNGSLRCLQQNQRGGTAPQKDEREKKKHRLWPLKRGDKSDTPSKPS